MMIRHEQNKEYRIAIDKNKLLIRVEVMEKLKENPLKIKMLYWNRQLENLDCCHEQEMELISRYNGVSVYEGIVTIDYVVSYLKYIFRIERNNEIQIFDYYGLRKEGNSKYAFEYIYTNSNDVLIQSKWLKESMFYQIFPERFCNGDTTNDPEEIVTWESKPTRTNFMGGDIKGIADNIEYLVDLGINAIYLNPIFQGKSNHKYDTVDYFKIDENFGTEDDFRSFIDKCHQNGIKVILDGVFNHCGSDFPQFVEAKNNCLSKYRDWFVFDAFKNESQIDVDYECVGYYKYMPKLNYSSDEVRKYFLEVGKFWIEDYDIDGWRLDVADEIDASFWYEFRREILAIKNDAILIAETWSEKKDMLYHNQMDSLMNYIFRDAVVDFIADQRISGYEFEERLSKIIGIYPSVISNQLYNLIGSHDTERFLTLVNGSIDKHKMAIGLMYMFKGIPALYYGDEVLLTGENDPGCRGTMDWNPKNTIIDYIKRLANIRKHNKEVRYGTYRANLCTYHCVGFVRSFENENIYTIINNSVQDEMIELPVFEEEGIMSELLYGKEEYVIKPIVNKKEYYNSDVNDYMGTVQFPIKKYELLILKMEVK